MLELSMTLRGGYNGIAQRGSGWWMSVISLTYAGGAQQLRCKTVNISARWVDLGFRLEPGKKSRPQRAPACSTCSPPRRSLGGTTCLTLLV